MPKKDRMLQTIRNGSATTQRAKPTVQTTSLKGNETIHRRPFNTNIAQSVARLGGGKAVGRLRRVSSQWRLTCRGVCGSRRFSAGADTNSRFDGNLLREHVATSVTRHDQ